MKQKDAEEKRWWPFHTLSSHAIREGIKKRKKTPSGKG
jgi:hypothetical protein